jgi:hypothetical protein
VESLQGAFADELRQLRDRVGRPTYAVLAKRSGIPKATIGDLLNGKFRQAPPWDTIRAVVLACFDGADDARARPELAWWRRRYDGLVTALDSARHTAGTGARESGAAPLGKPVDAVLPRELGVRRAVHVEDAKGLTPYVPRPHDAALAEVVKAAVAGRSGIAVLVSDSTSGKTRACYEALARLAEDPARRWQVWPATATGPETLRDALPSVPAGTVVWLDELRDYLVEPPTAVAEGIAVALRALLDDEAKRPVVVLATMWPRFWDLLTAHRRFERLLQGADIAVPDTFGDTARAAALATGDPGLVEAVTHAADGAVIQYLGGVPQLMDRYRMALATPAARGFMHAAVDARRARCSPRRPPATCRDGSGTRSCATPRGSTACSRR